MYNIKDSYRRDKGFVADTIQDLVIQDKCLQTIKGFVTDKTKDVL